MAGPLKIMAPDELHAIVAESGFQHALFCVEQLTTQIGREAADPLWVELGRLEQALDALIQTLIRQRSKYVC